MTTQHTLAESFRRLTSALAEIESDQPTRVDGVRTRLAAHVDGLIAGLADKTRPCPRHPGMPSHNCGPCRGERLGGLDA